MTIDIAIKPEVRGELDASKLSRLLEILPIISATFARASCLASVSHADMAMLHSTSTFSLNSNDGSRRGGGTGAGGGGLYTSSCFSSPVQNGISSNKSLNADSRNNLSVQQSLISNGMVLQTPTKHTIQCTSQVSPKELIGVETDESGSCYLTPPQSPPPLSMIQRKKTIEKEDNVMDVTPNRKNRERLKEKIQDKIIDLGRNIGEEDPNLSLPLEITEMIPDISDPRSGFGGSQFDILIPEDPLHVSMEIRVTIPEVGLDLTYDNAKGRHLVLSVRTLEMLLRFRPHDMEVCASRLNFSPLFHFCRMMLINSESSLIFGR